MMPKSSIRRKEFNECPDCLEEFKSKTALLEHSCPLQSDIAFGGEIEIKTEEDYGRKVVPVVTQANSEAVCWCDICAKPFKNLRGYKIHRSSHYNNTKNSVWSLSEKKSTVRIKREKTYVCSLCPMTLNGIREYRLHLKTHQPVMYSECSLPEKKSTVLGKRENTYVCSLCQLQLNGIREYRLHLKTHEPVKYSEYSLSEKKSTVRGKREKTYVCSLCPQQMNGIREYRLHLKTHQSVMSSPPTGIIDETLNSVVFPVLHKCPNCPRQFRKIGSYRRHLRSHLNIHAYSCKHCLISFLTKPELVAHVKQKHYGGKKYSCALCEKKFYHRMGFMQHKTEHLSNPPYECPMCDAVFTSISRRVRHLAHHTLKCPLCRKPFANDDTLRQHVANIHKDITNCDIPDETSEEDDSEPEGDSHSSFNELDIESDADSFTSIESNSEIYPSSPPKSDRQKSKNHHVCFICERRFPRQKSLDFHMKSHKIYMCLTCPMFFPLASQLKTHQKEHLEENSVLYSKLFNELQTSVPEQPLQTFPTLLLPTNVPVTDQSRPLSVGMNSQPFKSKVDSFDLIAWYTIFKEKSKYLKYPIGQDLYQDINQVISDLTATLYSRDSLCKELLDRYVKIYQELTEIIRKNGTYLCK